MKYNKEIIDWLLKGDPSIRFQTMRDLLNTDKELLIKEQQKISNEGWGAKLLSLQDSSDMWANGLYSPKWISTTYTMLLLRRMGLLPDNEQTKKACYILLEKGFYSDGGINFSTTINYSETCITGMVLSILAYFRYDDERLMKIVEHILKQQMKDGGWNCQSYKGATHSSFHTSISVLEGLTEYEKNYSTHTKEIKEAEKKAIEFLLIHKLFRSHRTGEIVDKRMTLFSFPPRWHYDIMKVLDYFQYSNIEKEKRMEDALKILKKKERKDHTWTSQNKHPGKTFFEMEQTGKASRWNTLRALRILKWWSK